MEELNKATLSVVHEANPDSIEPKDISSAKLLAESETGTSFLTRLTGQKLTGTIDDNLLQDTVRKIYVNGVNAWQYFDSIEKAPEAVKNETANEKAERIGARLKEFLMEGRKPGGFSPYSLAVENEDFLLQPVTVDQKICEEIQWKEPEKPVAVKEPKEVKKPKEVTAEKGTKAAKKQQEAFQKENEKYEKYLAEKAAYDKYRQDEASYRDRISKYGSDENKRLSVTYGNTRTANENAILYAKELNAFRKDAAKQAVRGKEQREKISLEELYAEHRGIPKERKEKASKAQVMKKEETKTAAIQKK